MSLQYLWLIPWQTRLPEPFFKSKLPEALTATLLIQVPAYLPLLLLLSECPYGPGDASDRTLPDVSPGQCYPGFYVRHTARIHRPACCLMPDDRAWGWRSTPGCHDRDNVVQSSPCPSAHGLRLVIARLLQAAGF